MAKEKENLEQQAQVETPDAMPNRDEYSRMWAEDNNDVDFEDKEARYGRAIEDRNELRERRKSDAELGKLFDTHDWLAQMYADLRDNPEMTAFEWFANFCNEEGVSVEEMLADPDTRKRLAESMDGRTKKEDEIKAHTEKVSNNLQKSYEALSSIFPDKSEDEINELWGKFWDVVEKAENGIVDEETIKGFSHALSYDEDVQAARNEGGMIARNEKITNKVRKPSETVGGLPPTLGQGAGAPPKKETPKKKDSFLDGLNG